MNTQNIKEFFQNIGAWIHLRCLLLSIMLFAGVFSVVSFAVYTRQVMVAYDHLIVRHVADLAPIETALVFGGGMEEDGSQSTMQKMRVETAVELYKKGKIKKIFFTGDDGAYRFDEISAMVYAARTMGVPVYDIETDPHGYRTYDSCYRAKNIYHLDHVVAISQDFHLSRILYFCNSFGIDTIGYSANDGGYSLDLRMALRETAARMLGWWQVNITRPKPMVEGK